MSATNRTTNYNLPIFIETDKPAWLVDFNGAMRSIDAQMKTNADAIATKSPILTFNDTADIDFTKSGDIITANLSSGVAGTVSRALVKPVSAPASTQIASVDSSNNQQMLNLGTGLEVESGTLNAIDLNLTTIGSGSASGFPANVSRIDGNMRYAFNSDKSIGKIYGVMSVRKTSTGNQVIEFDTGITVPAPSEAFTITPVGYAISNNNVLGWIDLNIKTDGHIYLSCWVAGSNGTTYITVIPFITFFRNFGDEPITP